MSRVLLVGATDGIGLALAHEYGRRGGFVGVVGRDPAKLERVLDELRETWPDTAFSGVLCDVTDEARVPEAFEEAVEGLGGVDLMVYCAGIQEPAGTPDERRENAPRLFDVNVLGAIRFLELACSHMLHARTGRIAAIGSVAGVRGRKGDIGYCSSKAALHAYLEGLRHRLVGSGVGVTTIKPGYVRTRRFLASREDPGGRVFPPAAEPASVARTIAKRLDRGSDEFFVPRWWGLIAAGLVMTPRVLYKRIAPG